MENKAMNKKTIIIVSVVVAVLVIALGFVFLFKNKDNNGTTSAGNSKVDEIVKKIEEKEDFAGMMQSIDSSSENKDEKEFSMSILESTFNITKEDVNLVKGKIPQINVKASMYLVVEAKEGKVEDVYKKLEEYGANYEKQWQTYLPDQYALVKQREIKKEGNIVYIVIPTERINKLAKSIDKIGNFTDETLPVIDDMTILESFFKLELEDVEMHIGRMSQVSTVPQMYLLVKPVEGETDDVLEDLTKFGNEYEAQNSNYANEQMEIIKNRKIGKTNDGICYLVISDKANEIEKLLK